MMATCFICGFEGEAGLGHWACHVDGDTTPVCRGKCWRAYEQRKAAVRKLGVSSAVEEFQDRGFLTPSQLDASLGAGGFGGRR